MDLTSRPGIPKGVCPFRGVTGAERRREGAWPPGGSRQRRISVCAGDGGGSNPLSRSNFLQSPRDQFLDGNEENLAFLSPNEWQESQELFFLYLIPVRCLPNQIHLDNGIKISY